MNFEAPNSAKKMNSKACWLNTEAGLEETESYSSVTVSQSVSSEEAASKILSWFEERDILPGIP